MGPITQVNIVNNATTILNNATRASAQFPNSASSLLADLSAFEASLAGAGLDQTTLSEIETIKADTVAAIRAQIAAVDASLAAL